MTDPQTAWPGNELSDPGGDPFVRWFVTPDGTLLRFDEGAMIEAMERAVLDWRPAAPPPPQETP